MQSGWVWRTALVVFFGLLFAVLGLAVREALWRGGPGDYSTELVVPPPPREPMRARVLDSETGGPIAGAEVFVDERSGDSPTTDAEGWVTLPDGEGVHTVHVLAKGHANVTRQISFDEPRMDHAFQLQPGVALRGRVMRGAAPVTGAEVEVRRLDWMGMLLDKAMTNERGEFSFEGLQERSVEVVARGDGAQGRLFVQLPDEDAVVLVSEAPLREMKRGAPGKAQSDAVDESGPRREVSVVDPDGKPVPGARVYAVSAEEPNPMALFRAGDAELLGYVDPEAKLSVVRRAEGCLVAGAWPFAPSPHQPCVSMEGQDAVTLRLRRASWASGQLSTSGLLVTESPEGAAAVSGADGGFRVGPLSAGKHRFSVSNVAGEAVGDAVEVDVAEGAEAKIF